MVPAEAIERAVTLLRAGGLVAYPTDTLYGLAVDPRSAEAVHRLFEVKGRHAGHAVPLIAADIAQAAEAARFDDRARRVAAACATTTSGGASSEVWRWCSNRFSRGGAFGGSARASRHSRAQRGRTQPVIETSSSPYVAANQGEA